MFRCTDCYKEYSNHPGYCECGNDQFEEILETNFVEQSNSYQDFNEDNYDEEYDDYEEQYIPDPAPKLKRKPVSKKSKKKSYSTFDKIGVGVFVVCIILSILSFIFIGAGQTNNNTKNSSKTSMNKNYNIPVDIDKIWDNTPITGSVSASTVTPGKLLNTKLNSLDSEMNSYLMSLAQAMIDSWDRKNITGDGVTQMEFKIQSDGTIAGRKIYKFSGNKSLDNSVGMLINNFGKFQVPPSSYNQEIIIISFSSKNGSQKAYYPNVKIKA
ncbi:TonB C-terminal domain-containing protein [bacterium]|nr:TonB C-terminal domain-containing protein [bacterium]